LGFVLGVAVMTSVLAQFPLIRNHIFYYWDDSAAAFLPSWYQMGTELRGGHWPVLDPSMWMGGNFAAESMLGVYNPISLGNFVLVSLLPDLAAAAAVVKTEFLVLFSVGVYLLAREYRANRPFAAVIATALPFAGYTLYFDAADWVGGLMAFAWLPLVWCTLRRYARGALNPIVPIVLGYLAISTGSPYGALGVVGILLAVGAEQLVRRRWRRFGGLVLIGTLIGVSTLVVFLPLLGSSAVGWRNSATIANDGLNAPHIGDLLGMSAPTYLPQFTTFGGPPRFPISYIAWFIVPLLPWLSWPTLRERFRELVGPLVFGVLFLALLFGPSMLWMYRDPMKWTGYVALPLGITFGVLLTVGLRTSRPLRRILASVALVLAGAYLSWSSTVHVSRAHLLSTLLDLSHGHLVATFLVLALLAATLFLLFRRPRLVPVVLAGGTALTLLTQVLVYPSNANTNGWWLPHNVAQMKADYGQRYQGNTLQVTDLGGMGSAGDDISKPGAWADLALGNTMHVGGVADLNSYTGVGDVAFSEALCMNYYGGTCADAYQRIWQPAGDGIGTQLANALRLQTVVMLTGYEDTKPLAGGSVDGHAGSIVNPKAPPLRIPAGWSVRQRTTFTTIVHRDAPLAWPGGRLSWSGTGVTVRSDEANGNRGERTTYTGQGPVLFAALAWPGWQATVDGRTVPVEQGPAGLMKVDLPSAAAGGSTLQLSFTPPGTNLTTPLIGFGLLGGVAFGALWEIRRRRRAA
jgi:hypothetical protein